MENAWNEYLKLENDVSQLKKALQEQMNSSLVSQVSLFPNAGLLVGRFYLNLKAIISWENLCNFGTVFICHVLSLQSSEMVTA